jgi:hypothetical protein
MKVILDAPFLVKLVQISIFLGTVDETANESHLKDSQKKKV